MRVSRRTLRWTLGCALGLALTQLPVDARAGLILFGSGQVDTATGPAGAFPSVFFPQFVQNPAPDLNASLVGADFDFTLDVDSGILRIQIADQFSFSVSGPQRGSNGLNLVLSGNTSLTGPFTEFVRLSFSVSVIPPPLFDPLQLPLVTGKLDSLRIDAVCLTCLSAGPVFLEGRVLQTGFRVVPEPEGLIFVSMLAFGVATLRRRARGV